MLAPCFLTDVLGFLLLTPPTRALVRAALMKRFKGKLGTGYSFLGSAGPVGGFVFGASSRGGDVFDTTAREPARQPELRPGDRP